MNLSRLKIKLYKYCRVLRRGFSACLYVILFVLVVTGIYATCQWWSLSYSDRPVVIYNYPVSAYTVKGDKVLYSHEDVLRLADRANRLCDCQAIYKLWEFYTIMQINVSLSDYWLTQGVDCGCTQTIFLQK